MIDHVSIKVKDVEQAKAFLRGCALRSAVAYVKEQYPGSMQLLVEGEPGDVENAARGRRGCPDAPRVARV